MYSGRGRDDVFVFGRRGSGRACWFGAGGISGCLGGKMEQSIGEGTSGIYDTLEGTVNIVPYSRKVVIKLP